jgi:Fe-S oxidoreductase
MECLLAAHDVQGEIYGHASAGCLHIRPLLNLKSGQGARTMRSIASQAVDLTLRLGGAISGEHGDGLARSEWYGRMFGEQILAAFGELKRAADPHELLNPGKRVSLSAENAVQPMDQNLRYGEQYHARAWQPNLDFSSQAGLEAAIEQCNGAGVCRKVDGVMCPSFQATQEEIYSTRGRANLLRALISNRFVDRGAGWDAAVLDALDLCLACKGCKAECPSAVDMAKLKYEFLDHYYRNHRRKLRDYLFGYIGPLARWAHPFGGLINPVLSNSIAKKFAGRLLGISPRRTFPAFSRHSLRTMITDLPAVSRPVEQMIFLSDAFTEYFYPEVGLACFRLAASLGVQVHVLPVLGAGRTLISKGFIDAARQHAKRLVAAVCQIDPLQHIPIVGVEPSEILTLCDEYPDLLPGNPHIRAISRRAYQADEWFVRLWDNAEMRVANSPNENINTKPLKKSYSSAMHEEHVQCTGHATRKIAIHGHCYQRARPSLDDGYPTGVAATVQALAKANYDVTTIQAGCCGMAGAFGYESEHYDLSMKVGEGALFPAIQATDPDILIAASGVSCRSQIADGTGRKAWHPIELLALSLVK